MSLDISTTAAAIKTRLETISGLQCRDKMPDNITPPMAVAWLKGPIEFDTTMARGCDRYVWAVTVVVCRADAENAQALLYDYLDGSGSSSIKAAVEGGTPPFGLGGIAAGCRVTSATPGDFISGDVTYWAAEYELDIYG